MRPLHFPSIERVLCLGAHADDIEIGCGGSLAKLIDANPAVEIQWVVLSGKGMRHAEARRSADRWLESVASKHVYQFDFSDGSFPAEWSSIKAAIHGLSRTSSPDLIFTHRLEDRHQDHRVVAEITWQAFRDQLILEYEIPKYEGDLAQPNVFVSLTRAQAQEKIQRLTSLFPSQSTKPWFDPELFQAQLKLRGIECRADYAEAFYARKIPLRF